MIFSTVARHTHDIKVLDGFGWYQCSVSKALPPNITLYSLPPPHLAVEVAPITSSLPSPACSWHPTLPSLGNDAKKSKNNVITEKVIKHGARILSLVRKLCKSAKKSTMSNCCPSPAGHFALLKRLLSRRLVRSSCDPWSSVPTSVSSCPLSLLTR